MSLGSLSIILQEVENEVAIKVIVEIQAKPGKRAELKSLQKRSMAFINMF